MWRFLLSSIVLYIIIRLAVQHGTIDALNKLEALKKQEGEGNNQETERKE